MKKQGLTGARPCVLLAGSAKKGGGSSAPSPPGPSVEKMLLTVEETALFLGISPNTIRCGIARRPKKRFPIKPIRINGSVRFDRRDILAFIDSMKEAQDGTKQK